MTGKPLEDMISTFLYESILLKKHYVWLKTGLNRLNRKNIDAKNHIEYRYIKRGQTTGLSAEQTPRCFLPSLPSQYFFIPRSDAGDTP